MLSQNPPHNESVAMHGFNQFTGAVVEIPKFLPRSRCGSQDVQRKIGTIQMFYPGIKNACVHPLEEFYFFRGELSKGNDDEIHIVVAIVAANCK